MNVISHRGLWTSSEDKNTYRAFQRSFESGYGTEVDVRDYCGCLVVSHDIATRTSLSVEHFIELYIACGDLSLPLAINIKSDGLAAMLNKILKNYKIKNYFVFDMSLPETIRYLALNARVYCRSSEYEPQTELFSRADGIWFDSFNSAPFDSARFLKVISSKSAVCIVSDELHGRDPKVQWNKIKDIISMNDIHVDFISICTDLPAEARAFFNEK